MPRGGARENAGRKPKEFPMTHYERNTKILNDETGNNIRFLIKVRDDEKLSLRDRMKAVEIMLKKSLPDVKAVHYDKRMGLETEDDKMMYLIKRLGIS